MLHGNHIKEQALFIKSSGSLFFLKQIEVENF